MRIEKEELSLILAEFNPWWRGDKISDLPDWTRAQFNEIYKWISTPPVHRATFISGARQIGKTTLIMQTIKKLLESGVPSNNIFYATFDHPIVKLAGIDESLKAWRQRIEKLEGIEYIFLDEAQFIPNWGTWIKHQIDFNKQRRIIFTGSATPILQSDQESGVGRWHTIKLTTFSFYEYTKLKKLNLPELPKIKSLKEIFDWDQRKLDFVSENAASYILPFHDYLLRGGFPQTILIDNVNQAQKLREDIVDKVLKRDMTAMFGVRKVLELEQTFLYLCLHDGLILDINSLCSNLEIKRPTVEKFLELFEASNLIYKLKRFGYGKEVTRGKNKIYLSDPAISPSVMLKGKTVIDNPQLLGICAESAVLKHLVARYYSQNIKFSYWQNKKGLEVDLVAEVLGEIIPFEVKYRNDSSSDCKGLFEFCAEKNVNRGYIITKSCNDFKIIKSDKLENTQILKIPATLLCYFIGEMEINQH
ncbi:MAG: ATP-binding protein [Pelagibacterales bacterium]|nr:ATP-binding protein [Pelagibacterales bacterium]